MGKRFLNKMKTTLTAQRKEIIARLAEANGEIDIEGDEVDVIQAKLLATIGSKLSIRDRDKIHQIDSALKKIAEGEYGSCSDCGEDISQKRLETIPFAILCLDCTETKELEQKRGAIR